MESLSSFLFLLVWNLVTMLQVFEKEPTGVLPSKQLIGGDRAWWHILLAAAFGRHVWVDLCDPEVSMVYVVSSR